MSLRLQNGSLKAVFTFAFLLLSTFMLLPIASATTAVDPEGNYKYFTATVVWNSEAAVQNVPVLLRFSESTISGFDRGDVTESGLEIVDEDGKVRKRRLARVARNGNRDTLGEQRRIKRIRARDN